MLVFDVELLGIKEAPKPPKVPEDVAAVPDNAEKTASGLASRVLKKGDGKENPKATDRVLVHYTGWTTDGKMFDSYVARGEPIAFPLNRVIAGWTEGVQLMSPGAKYQFIIPHQLAYGEAGAMGVIPPKATLHFEIELLEFS